ncbi:zinc-binding alcohol dehydrogenase family protein [Spirosoma montaniterrae]|uniref:L-iditol 2-dehydrogenase n=1 Tax=Spirosoma montaniterrae TaxID=1178516 RepID=A0A1P9WZB7_9BACT|nr:zinc-binding alcohol dehydrogenase family protein [Spirosoma montaniterrae]AQG80720.1 L-iditol 2-dehydrogenase [Spirosoma montaniterrae]
MNAIILEQPGAFSRITKDHPGPPAAGQVLLKIRRLGVCGTDLHAYNGKQPFFTYPRILGHEIAAEVIALGEGVTHLNVGDRCAVMPYRNTSTDQAVRRGKTHCGDHVRVLGVHEDGAMQEYMLYLADHVYPANALSLDQIAMIEPLAIGSHAIERGQVGSDDIVLVVGAGPIGIAAILMGQFKAARIIALDMNQDRLDFVAHKCPGVDTMKVSDGVIGELQTLLNGDLPTVVIDATGNKASMEKCVEYVAPGGTVVYVGLFIGDLQFHDPYIQRKELTLKTSRNAYPDDFTKIIRLMESGLLNIDGYVTHRLAFDTLTETFTSLYDPQQRVIKAVIEF